MCVCEHTTINRKCHHQIGDWYHHHRNHTNVCVIVITTSPLPCTNRINCLRLAQCDSSVVIVFSFFSLLFYFILPFSVNCVCRQCIDLPLPYFATTVVAA